MNRFFKFIVMGICFCFLIKPINAEAQQVPISNMGAYQLVQTYNNYENVKMHALELEEPIKEAPQNALELDPTGNYDIYASLPASHSCCVFFFCNKSGYVSKFTIISNQDGESLANSSFISVGLLYTIGLTNEQIHTLLHERKLWVNNRWICFGSRQNNDNNTYTAMYIAFDQ